MPEFAARTPEDTRSNRTEKLKTSEDKVAPRKKRDGKKMAGAAGLEPVTSAVTGQRSNQLSYTPVKGSAKVRNVPRSVNGHCPDFLGERIRAADAKEVGVGNPAEETYRYPNQSFLFATLNIGPQMSMHKGRKLFSKAFLHGRRSALFVFILRFRAAL